MPLAKIGARERVPFVYHTADACRGVWSLKNIDWVCEWSESHVKLESLNTDLAEVCKKEYDQEALQSKIGDAQDPSSQLDAPRESVCEHSMAIELHLAQIAQELSVAQANLAKMESNSRAMKTALINVRDAIAHHGLLAAEPHQFINPSLQKSVWDFFMWVSNHVHAEW